MPTKKTSLKSMDTSKTVTATFALAVLVACGQGTQSARTDLTEPVAVTHPGMPDDDLPAVSDWTGSRYAVAAANPLAVEAGVQALARGGSAVDAAIAVQLVLTLVEPQASGIGGGAFLLHWDGAQVTAFDGREVAPAAATEELFLDSDGAPLPFHEAVVSGLSVGVPGTLAMLRAAHERHGVLPWEELFEPAITLSAEGFEVSPRLHQLLEVDDDLRNDPIARALYYDETGAAHPVGYRLRNPALAEILRRIAQEGISAFYLGPVAEDVVQRVSSHSQRPGSLSLDDLAAYPRQDFLREPICTEWREYLICGFPPPSSGHLAIMQILGIMEALDEPPEPLLAGLPSASWLHLYLEASKLAFADRALYVADPAFVSPPGPSWESLLNPDYLQQRALLVGSESMNQARPGVPGETAELRGLQPPQPETGTSHISIVDAEGRAVAMTTTIETIFGSRLMSSGGSQLIGGFHLNNQLTDFSLAPRDSAGLLIANRVEAGKRPRSSMSPSLVFERSSGELVAILGSPGGPNIIHYTAKTLLGMLAWGLPVQAAIDLPNFANHNGPSLLEAGRFPSEIIDALRGLGHEVQEIDLTSGLHVIRRSATRLWGGADPRREGVVRGR